MCENDLDVIRNELAIGFVCIDLACWSDSLASCSGE